MFIFDDLVSQVENINDKYDSKHLSIDLNQRFTENNNQIIFNNDKAFELGANPYKGITLDLVTDSVFDDEIVLLGDDLQSISKDGNYARIVIASADKSQMGTGNILYNSIRKFDYVKYHLSYDGVMFRESVFNKKESILVSKNALKKDTVSFSKLGSYIISKYKELSFIKNVKVLFVTLNDYQYVDLSTLVTKCENITKALDHLMNKVNMDCHSCSLQVICNEVEKKVNEDFKKD